MEKLFFRLSLEEIPGRPSALGWQKVVVKKVMWQRDASRYRCLKKFLSDRQKVEADHNRWAKDGTRNILLK
jgi:hypothetical protein